MHSFRKLLRPFRCSVKQFHTVITQQVQNAAKSVQFKRTFIVEPAKQQKSMQELLYGVDFQAIESTHGKVKINKYYLENDTSMIHSSVWIE